MRIMKSERVRCLFAAKLCESLNANEINFGIIHGAEDFPNTVGRDLDILVGHSDLGRAASVVSNVASGEGWGVLEAPMPWAGKPVIFWKLFDDSLLSFEMHFISKLEWAGIVLAELDQRDIRHHPNHNLPLAMEAGFAKRFLTQILAGCWSRMEERSHELYMRESEITFARKRIEFLFGSDLSGQLLGALSPPNINAIRKLAPAMRFSIMRRALLPGFPVEFSPKWIMGKLFRSLGIIDWKLPNIAIEAEHKADARKFLNDALTYLSFAKSMVIPNKRRSIKTRIKMHLHRGLLRYVGTYFRSGDVKIENVFGASKVNSGNLLIQVVGSKTEFEVRAELRLGAQTGRLNLLALRTQIGPLIAAVFFQAAKATEYGIEKFRISQ